MPLIFKHQQDTQRYRTWGAIGAAAVGVVGGYVANSSGGKDKNGGAGATSQTKDPWLPATPWLMQNLGSGQALQQQYTDQPFNAQQQQAYANQYAQSDYMRQLVPSLLGQISGQTLGFDRNNPQAKPNAYQFNAAGSGANLGMGASGAGSMQAAQAAQDAIDAANRARKAPADDGSFINQTDVLTGANMGGLNPLAAAGGIVGTGKYGSFVYGMQPQPGTQAYRDMSAYFANGGADPNNYYGHGTPRANDPFAGLQSGGVASPGASASAASGGASGGAGGW